MTAWVAVVLALIAPDTLAVEWDGSRWTGDVLCPVENESGGWLFVTVADGGGLVRLDPPARWVAPRQTVLARVIPLVPTDVAGEYSASVTLYAEPRVLGDVDGDGEVSVLDVMAVVTSVGLTDWTADFDGSGAVDVLDVVTVVERFGATDDGPTGLTAGAAELPAPTG